MGSRFFFGFFSLGVTLNNCDKFVAVPSLARSTGPHLLRTVQSGSRHPRVRYRSRPTVSFRKNSETYSVTAFFQSASFLPLTQKKEASFQIITYI